nr:MAG TPA: hypothetical protein [Caudoviricetes sp.]
MMGPSVRRSQSSLSEKMMPSTATASQTPATRYASHFIPSSHLLTWLT